MHGQDAMDSRWWLISLQSIRSCRWQWSPGLRRVAHQQAADREFLDVVGSRVLRQQVERGSALTIDQFWVCSGASKGLHSRRRAARHCDVQRVLPSSDWTFKSASALRSNSTPAAPDPGCVMERRATGRSTSMNIRAVCQQVDGHRTPTFVVERLHLVERTPSDGVLSPSPQNRRRRCVLLRGVAEPLRRRLSKRRSRENPLCPWRSRVTACPTARRNALSCGESCACGAR